MTLPSGTRLGPYELLSPLGAGGMGEVYRARDTRLDRAVAVKVLPAHLSASKESRQRFEREARTISQLSHPHICALYDVGREGDTEYLVMELLEGETLEERLVKGALSTDQVLRFGIEIADALDRAHRQGIVHRDLKPGNIMLTRSGVKLLDFGLAKAIAPLDKDPASGLTSMPTQVGSNLTREGSILGTFEYMAPEQLEGKDADARTDIFAFGAVLYEMATGRKAFSGTSQASLISNIMKEEPAAISTVQPMTPPALDRVVRTCLAKDPDDRFQTAHDAGLQLQWVAEGGSQAGAPAVVTARRKSRERLAWGVAAGAILTAAFATLGYVRRAPVEAPVLRSSLLPPDKTAFEVGGEDCGSLTISPDGRRITFVAKDTEGKKLLWLRPLDAGKARSIPGTEGATWPFWSPDSRFIAFFAQGTLKKVDAAGAPPLTLCDAIRGRPGSWNRDGVVLFSPDTTVAVRRVSAGGGPATPVTRLDESKGETTHRWATFLPDGRHFLYMAGTHATGAGTATNVIYVASLDSKDRRPLLVARSNVVFASGYLIYVLEKTLLAQPFDAKRLRLTGDPVPVGDSVLYDPDYFRAAFSASDNGILVYAAGIGGSKLRLAWYDRSGKPIGVPFGDPVDYRDFSISPDGKRLAAEVQDSTTGLGDIWLSDFVRGTRTRFSFGPGPSMCPVWSPEGTRIAFQRMEKTLLTRIVAKPLSGGGGEETLLQGSGDICPKSWSPDGRYLAYETLAAVATTKSDIWILPLLGDRKPFPFLATQFDELSPQFSPDGRWVLYTSDESGRPELYVAPFPGPGSRWQISDGGALGGDWRHGGREITYLTLDRKQVSVEVKADVSGFETGLPRVLFNANNATFFRSDRSGDRELMAVPPETAQYTPFTLVSNWPALVKK
jgi:Tol biopolymer transport system component/tRNA A-37 threonylcarbamoyl transferase component Bud32